MPPPQPQRPLTDRGDVDDHGNLSDRKNWVSGILIQFHYLNSNRTKTRGTYSAGYKHDPFPICTVLYSDRRYTHAINIRYLTGQQRRQFKAQLRFWYFIDPRLKYYYLKVHNKSVLHAYRTYFSHLLHATQAWEIPELEGSIPEAYNLLKSVNGDMVPTDFQKVAARQVAAARARDAAVIQREVMGTQRPNQQRAFSRPNARPLLERVQTAARQLQTRIDSGAIRPAPTSVRPRSQRPGQ